MGRLNGPGSQGSEGLVCDVCSGGGALKCNVRWGCRTRGMCLSVMVWISRHRCGRRAGPQHVLATADLYTSCRGQAKSHRVPNLQHIQGKRLEEHTVQVGW